MFRKNLDTRAAGLYLALWRRTVYSERSSRAVKVREMPSEITNTDQFVSLSEGALECRVKRAKDLVKLKLRTPHQLYTHKVKVERADDVIKRLKCEIVEV
jgi:hypothetical protein